MSFSVGNLLADLGATIGNSGFGDTGRLISAGLTIAAGQFQQTNSPIGRQTAAPVVQVIQAPATQIAPTAFSGATNRFGSPFQLAGLGGRGVAAGAGVVGGLALDAITGMFGGSPKNLTLILKEARANTGGSVTKNNIIDAAKACGIDVAASTFGLDVTQICFVVLKGRSRRRRGISAADIRRTKRVIKFNKSLTKDLRLRK